ncbi:MAG: histidine kinase, partial [Rhizobacter sp.]
MAATGSSLSSGDVPLRDRGDAASEAPSYAGGSESAFDSGLLDRSFARESTLSRWMGWRLRLLVGAALLGCMALFFLARWLGDPPHIDATWRPNAYDQLELAST